MKVNDINDNPFGDITRDITGFITGNSNFFRPGFRHTPSFSKFFISSRRCTTRRS